MMLHSITREIKLPGEKIKRIGQEAHRLLAIEQPLAQLLSLLGKLNATTPALQMAPFLPLTSNVSEASSSGQPVIPPGTGRSPMVETPP